MSMKRLFYRRFEMNNKDIIAYIEAGTIGTAEVLELCKSVNRYPSQGPGLREIADAFVSQWYIGNNGTATGKDFIDLIRHTTYGVQEDMIAAAAKMWTKEDFDYSLSVLTRRLNILLAIAKSEKYSQEELFTVSQEFSKLTGRYAEQITDFWTSAVNSGVLDGEGLYKVAADEHYPTMYSCEMWGKSEEVALLAISKKLMTSEQLVEISSLYCLWKVTLAAVATQSLSDDQTILLSKHRPNQTNIWRSFAPHLRLEARTAEELAVFGKKVGSDDLWAIIRPLIESR